MRVLDTAEIDGVRGGIYYAEDQVDGDGGGGGGYQGGNVDVGGGFALTEYTMTSLLDEASNGTDQSVESMAENMYATAQSNPFGPGGQYYVAPPGSPPPSFRDIYNSIPGVPKDKVRKVSHTFKIC